MAAFSDFVDVTTIPPSGGSSDWGPSFNSLIASGAKIYVPGGVYTINTPINLGNATSGLPIHIIGSGVGKTYLRGGVSNQAIIQLLSTELPPWSVTIEGMSLDQPGGLTGVVGISLESSPQRRLSNPILKTLHFSSLSKAISLLYCANTFIDQVFAIVCDNGVVITQCADTNISNVEVQLGNNIGFHLSGFNDGSANDEGIRMVNCSTNGQAIGLQLDKQNIGDASSCSFTTCTGGCLIAHNSTNWRFSACEFAGGINGGAAVNTDSSCSLMQFAGCSAFDGTFGFILKGSQHTVTGCNAINNTQPDVYLGDATNCVITGNSLLSSTPAYSVDEAAPGTGVGPSDYNLISCNIGRKPFFSSGAHTLNNNNVISP